MASYHINMSDLSSNPDLASLSMLHVAAVNGDKSTIEILLKKSELDDYKCDVNERDKYGRTALVYTIFGDWFDCAELLLRNGAVVSNEDRDKRTPLHWAAYLGKHKFISLLLRRIDKTIDWNTGDLDGRTPLHYAAAHRNAKCLRLLLKHALPGTLDVTDREKKTALHWSVYYGNFEQVKLLKEARAKVHLRDAKWNSFLHLAVANTNPDSVRIVRYLLKINRFYSTQKDCQGRTPLHLAVANQNESLVKELCIAPVSALDELDNMSRSALHYAVLRSNVQVVNILISNGVSLYKEDSAGATPLHYVAKNNSVEVLQRFLACDKLEDIPDKQGRTALMWAASEGSGDVLDVMLKKSRCFDVHAKDKQGLSPLHFACISGHLACVMKLITNSADVRQPDKLGQSPLFKACQQGHVTIADFLMNNELFYLGNFSTSSSSSKGLSVTIADEQGREGITKDREECDQTFEGESHYASNSGGTLTKTGNALQQCLANRKPVITSPRFGVTDPKPNPNVESSENNHSAVAERSAGGTSSRGRSSTSRLAMNRKECIRNLEDCNGCTPLHFAAHSGHVAVCRWLLDNGVDPWKKDVIGRTALHGAAFNGHLTCMGLMLEECPGLKNDRDNDGYSALHRAAVNGHLEAVKMLVLEHNAFPNYRVKSSNLTPLDLAMGANQQDVTQFLIDHGGLTIAGVEEVASDTIKRYLREWIFSRRRTTLKPLLDKHKLLTRELGVRNVRSSSVVSGATEQHNMVGEDTIHDSGDSGGGDASQGKNRTMNNQQSTSDQYSDVSTNSAHTMVEEDMVQDECGTSECQNSTMNEQQSETSDQYLDVGANSGHTSTSVDCDDESSVHDDASQNNSTINNGQDTSHQYTSVGSTHNHSSTSVDSVGETTVQDVAGDSQDQHDGRIASDDCRVVTTTTDYGSSANGIENVTGITTAGDCNGGAEGKDDHGDFITTSDNGTLIAEGLGSTTGDYNADGITSCHCDAQNLCDDIVPEEDRGMAGGAEHDGTTTIGKHDGTTIEEHDGTMTEEHDGNTTEEHDGTTMIEEHDCTTTDEHVGTRTTEEYDGNTTEEHDGSCTNHPDGSATTAVHDDTVTEDSGTKVEDQTPRDMSNEQRDDDTRTNQGHHGTSIEQDQESINQDTMVDAEHVSTTRDVLNIDRCMSSEKQDNDDMVNSEKSTIDQRKHDDADGTIVDPETVGTTRDTRHGHCVPSGKEEHDGSMVDSEQSPVKHCDDDDDGEHTMNSRLGEKNGEGQQDSEVLSLFVKEEILSSTEDPSTESGSNRKSEVVDIDPTIESGSNWKSEEVERSREQQGSEILLNSTEDIVQTACTDNNEREIIGRSVTDEVPCMVGESGDLTPLSSSLLHNHGLITGEETEESVRDMRRTLCENDFNINKNNNNEGTFDLCASNREDVYNAEEKQASHTPAAELHKNDCIIEDEQTTVSTPASCIFLNTTNPNISNNDEELLTNVASQPSNNMACFGDQLPNDFMDQGLVFHSCRQEDPHDGSAPDHRSSGVLESSEKLSGKTGCEDIQISKQVKSGDVWDSAKSGSKPQTRIKSPNGSTRGHRGTNSNVMESGGNLDREQLKHLPKPPPSSSLKEKRSFGANFSPKHHAGRAPDHVVAASEREKILRLRRDWERISAVREKIQAALTIQRYFRRYLARKGSGKEEAVSFGEHSNNGQRPESPTKHSSTKRVSPAFRKTLHKNGGETAASKSKVPARQQQSRAASSKDRGALRSCFPTMPQSTSASESVTMQPPRSSTMHHDEVATPLSPANLYYRSTLTTNEMVQEWLHKSSTEQQSGGLGQNASPRRRTQSERNPDPNFQNEYIWTHSLPANGSEPVSYRQCTAVTEQSRSGNHYRRRTALSAGQRCLSRDTLAKTVYASPAAVSYNFALDTYHPLASRRGCRQPAFPFKTSTRVRPNSMKRGVNGWVLNGNTQVGSTSGSKKVSSDSASHSR